MKRTKKAILAVALMIAGVVSVFGTSAPVFANAFNQDACNQISDEGQREALGCNNDKNVPEVATNIIKIAVSLLGIVAVLMVIVAGQRYMTSNGEPEKIKQARNMIIYSLIGLIVAILAFAIVSFVQNGVFG